MKKLNWPLGFLVLVFLFSFAIQDVYARGSRSTVFGAGSTTVAEALQLRDDTPVVLQGRIVRHIRSEYYLFSDETGVIRIEIPPRIWGDIRVTQDDKIEITGIIDRHLFARNRIYVRSIRLLLPEVED
jgi:uncharacterized protein (TIGR00156 family)